MVRVTAGNRTETIYASTAAVLLPAVWNVFGPGIVRDSEGGIITIEAGGVNGDYTWSAEASGKLPCMPHA